MDFNPKGELTWYSFIIIIMLIRDITWMPELFFICRHIFICKGLQKNTSISYTVKIFRIEYIDNIFFEQLKQKRNADKGKGITWSNLALVHLLKMFRVIQYDLYIEIWWNRFEFQLNMYKGGVHKFVTKKIVGSMFSIYFVIHFKYPHIGMKTMYVCV